MRSGDVDSEFVKRAEKRHVQTQKKQVVRNDVVGDALTLIIAQKLELMLN